MAVTKHWSWSVTQHILPIHITWKTSLPRKNFDMQLHVIGVFEPKKNINHSSLTLTLLTLRIWAPNNARKWQMGFNLSFKGLNMMSKNQVSTTIYWTKMHIPSLTLYWNSSKWCTNCCHTTWPSEEWYELSERKCPCIFTHYEVLFMASFFVQFSDKVSI